MKTENDNNRNVKKVGYYSSILMVIVTFITWAIGMTALPNSGEYCIKNCVDYPYLDTLSEFPGDYFWMFLAPLQVLIYLIFVVSVHSFASIQHKIFSRIGLTFALIASVVLLLCYYIQFTVVPAGLISGETDGISLLTQFNPHGLFIASEELGYIMMCFSFLAIAPVFANKTRIELFIRWIFIIAFVLTVISFIVVALIKGMFRGDLFELIAISIDWLTLIINGILASIVFKRALKQEQQYSA